MKKIISLVLSAFLLITLISVFAVPTSAVDGVDLAGELIFTEIQANTAGTDYCEYMEIMNISDHAIDLYDFRLWYYEAGRSVVFPVEKQGVYVMNAGEIAIVPIVNNNTAVCVDFSGDINSDGSNRKYDTDMFRTLVVSNYDWSASLSETTRIFFLDSAPDSSGAQPATPDAANKWCKAPDGTPYGNGKGVACGNSDGVFFGISKRDTAPVSTVYASENVVIDDIYTYVMNMGKSEGSCHFGAPLAGSKQCAMLEAETRIPTPGYLSDAQKASIATITVTNFLSITDPVEALTTAEPVITTVPATTAPAVTTAEPVTTTKPVDTTKAAAEVTTAKPADVTTKAPVAEKKGCGNSGAILIIAQILLTGGACAIFIGSKKH